MTINIKETCTSLVDNVAKVIVGKEDITRLLFVALLCEGHVLIEDVPGIGKTTLARAISKSVGCIYKRIQFTPDLLPADVTGIHFFNQKTSDFELLPGPVMANIVLADEINRATPRTQSALLECMQEKQVTIDGDTIPLPHPFMVIATENPIESEGTFPLPEAQIDRFLLRLSIGYPDKIQEKDIILRFMDSNPLQELEPVITSQELIDLQKQFRKVMVEDSVLDYIVTLCRATRDYAGIHLGASPRATLSLCYTSQAWAAIQGRDFVIPDDVKHLAVPVLAHRLIIDMQSQFSGKAASDIVEEIVNAVPVPVETIS